MQQAYSALRVIAESQTIRLILTLQPNERLLTELTTACNSLHNESSSGVKAIILDFQSPDHAHTPSNTASDNLNTPALNAAITAIQAVEQPLIAVVRATPSPAASLLIEAADLVLLSSSATLTIQNPKTGQETVSSSQAVHQGLATWSSDKNIDNELERILDMLRTKSAIALRHTKASVYLASSAQQPTGQPAPASRLAALQQINAFYLTEVMRSADAAEGLTAFLEKRQPQWKNR